MATIALDNLKPQDPLKLQTLPQDTTDYASIINSAVGNPMELDKQVQGQETQVQSSLNTLSGLMQEGAGIGSQQLAMENQAGISQQQKEVQDLTNQLNAIKTQANVIPMQIQQESAGRGRTEAGIAPLQTAELRNNAIQALTVGAQLQAKQGNLALAQSQIDRAIELKYRDIENRTKLAELNYNRNKETLERIDKKRADALGYAIQKQKEKDAANKANELAIQNMIVEATPNAPASVISNARKLAESGASRLAVAESLGEYAGDYWGTKIKIAQYNKLLSESSKLKAEADAKGVGSTSKMTSVDQAKFLLDSIAQAKNLSSASGRSAGRRKLEEFTVGATDYTNLEAKVRTVKNNLLTLATDPEIKKFFGPQMTESDVKNMLGAATTLDTEAQTPKELKDELERAEKIFQKFAPDYKSSVPVKETPQTWATGISSMWTSPNTGGNYGYTDNKQ